MLKEMPRKYWRNMPETSLVGPLVDRAGARADQAAAVTVALGATAARSLTGKTLTISRVREAPLTLADGGLCWVTVHPSSLLRIPDEDRRREERALFVRDLKRIKARAESLTQI